MSHYFASLGTTQDFNDAQNNTEDDSRELDCRSKVEEELLQQAELQTRRNILIEKKLNERKKKEEEVSKQRERHHATFIRNLQEKSEIAQPGDHPVASDDPQPIDMFVRLQIEEERNSRMLGRDASLAQEDKRVKGIGALYNRGSLERAEERGEVPNLPLTDDLATLLHEGKGKNDISKVQHAHKEHRELLNRKKQNVHELDSSDVGSEVEGRRARELVKKEAFHELSILNPTLRISAGSDAAVRHVGEHPKQPTDHFRKPRHPVDVYQEAVREEMHRNAVSRLEKSS